MGYSLYRNEPHPYRRSVFRKRSKSRRAGRGYGFPRVTTPENYDPFYLDDSYEDYDGMFMMTVRSFTILQLEFLIPCTDLSLPHTENVFFQIILGLKKILAVQDVVMAYL